jgi:hypothetical protein
MFTNNSFDVQVTSSTNIFPESTQGGGYLCSIVNLRQCFCWFRSLRGRLVLRSSFQSSIGTVRFPLANLSFENSESLPPMVWTPLICYTKAQWQPQPPLSTNLGYIQYINRYRDPFRHRQISQKSFEISTQYLDSQIFTESMGCISTSSCRTPSQVETIGFRRQGRSECDHPIHNFCLRKHSSGDRNHPLLR